MAFCKNCGTSVDPNAAVCMSCGFAKGTGQKYCANCGKEAVVGATICTACGFALREQYVLPVGVEQKSKLVAGLLGVFLGVLGVHNFYLGNNMKAGLQLALTIIGFLLTCFFIGFLILAGVFLWGFVEGILILCGQIKRDGKGIPLKG